MKRTLLLLVVAACGPKSVAKVPPPANTGGEVSAGPVYGGMFVESARWAFDIETLDDSLSDTSPSGFDTTTDAFQATCHVAALTRFGDVTISEVACDDTWPTTSPLAAIYAMDPRGLWLDFEWFDDTAPVLDGNPTIANPPDAWRKEEHDDAGELVSVTEVLEEQGAWCYRVGYVQGDSSWDTVCFDGGPVRGDHGWSGALEHSYTFELAH